MSAPAEALPAVRLAPWRWLFATVGVYDLVLGLGFLLAWEPLFETLGIAPPETAAYVQLSAALISVQGAGYLLVVRRPMRNYDLVALGALYKLAYTGLAAYYWAIDELPHGIFLVFGLADALMLAAFAAFLWLFREQR